MTDVLHVPYTFFPDRTGGTETYVAALVRGLRGRGIESAVAAPVETGMARDYEHEGTPVFRFGTGAGDLGLADQYGAGDPVAAAAFAGVVARVRPRIVHLHGWTSGISLRLVDAARAAGARLVFTYHTPAVSCARGSLMIYGREVCDGALLVDRCSRCVLQQHGVPLAIGRLLGKLPPRVGRMLGRRGLEGRGWTALRMTELMAERHRAFRQLLERVDAIVAVQDWVFDLLIHLGADRRRLTLSRLALPNLDGEPASRMADRTGRKPGSAVRLAFFGRLDSTKGAHLVIGALAGMPGLPMELDLYGAPQGVEGERYVADLRAIAAGDSRIRFHPPVAAREVVRRMAEYDALVVPSIWMETGPLVVPEALAAGIPVIGADRGGIPTFLRDGIDGLLVAPGDQRAWARAMRRLVDEPALLPALRAGIRPPETMTRVIDEMVAVYGRLDQP